MHMFKTLTNCRQLQAPRLCCESQTSLKCSWCISRQMYGTVPVSGSTVLRCSRRNAAARSTSEGRWAESTTTSVRSACSTLEKQSSLHFSHKPTADTRPVMMAWQVFLITACVSISIVSISDVAPERCLLEATFPQQRENRVRCSQDTLWVIAEVKMKVKGESSCSPNQE